MYKLTKNKTRQNVICKRMRAGKERKRLTLASETSFRDYIQPPNNLRKVVIVINYDFETKIDIYRLNKTNRIDSFMVSRNSGIPNKMGWSNFCKRLSVYYPRILSTRNL